MWVDIIGVNFGEVEIMREYILKGFDEIEKRKK